MRTLDEVLSHAPARAPSPEAERQTAEAEAPPERVETGEENAPEPASAEAEAPQPEATTPPPGEGKREPEAEKPQAKSATVPLSALEDERKKRQELERREADLAKRFQELQAAMQRQAPPAQPPAAPQPVTFDWDDPNKPLTALQQQITHTQQSLPAYVQAQIAQVKADLSESMVAAVHPDYPEVRDYFMEHLRNECARLGFVDQAGNPVLSAHPFSRALATSANPAKDFYEAGKRLRALSEIGDPVAYRERLEKELREKWEAERATSAPPQPEGSSRPALLPRTLADARAAPARTAGQTFSPRSLSDILNR